MWQRIYISLICLATKGQPPQSVSKIPCEVKGQTNTKVQTQNNTPRINMAGHFALCLNLPLLLFVVGKCGNVLTCPWASCVTGGSLLQSVKHKNINQCFLCLHTMTVNDLLLRCILHVYSYLRGSSPAPYLSQDCQHCSQCSWGGWRSRRRACGSVQDVGRTALTAREASPASLYSVTKIHIYSS